MRSQKAQAMVEFILVAAFAVALVVLCFGKDSWLPGSAKTLYNRTWAALDEEPSYTTMLAEYGSASLAEVAAIDNAQRVAADREALANLGRAFLGKNLSELKAMMKANSISEGDMFYYGGLARNQGIRLFDYDISNRGDGIQLREKVWSNNSNPDAEVRSKLSNPRPSTVDAIQWMEGDYDHFTNKKITASEQDVRYFFSDDMIYADGVVDDPNKNGKVYNASVRATFTFDENNTVDSVRLWVTRNQEREDKPGSWTVVTCNDLLDVIVTK